MELNKALSELSLYLESQDTPNVSKVEYIKMFSKKVDQNEFSYGPFLDPTPSEYLHNKHYHQTKPKESGDYGKAIAIYSEPECINLKELYSPSASIGICQLENGKYLLVFKNKPKMKGFALPGGTLGIDVNFDPASFSYFQRFQSYAKALEREFLEECGVMISDKILISVASPSGRLNHSCAIFLCKGQLVQSQRAEDSDHIVMQVTLTELVTYLNSSLGLDTFMGPILKSCYGKIVEYFV